MSHLQTHNHYKLNTSSKLVVLLCVLMGKHDDLFHNSSKGS